MTVETSNNMSQDSFQMTIPEYFKGKSIFVTGGSGFIGRVFIEKLLRSCPELKNVYMLIRPKRNLNIEERVRQLTDVPLFDKLREQDRDFVRKIIPIAGNISELELGISKNDRQRIIENVSIVYHSAASVRFDDDLKDAVFTNLRSTREIISLAQELKTLDVLVHISTLYANSDNKFLEEKLYPRHDWREVIDLAESCDENVMKAMTQKYIAPLPNTYTFTKSLAELALHELCNDKIPAVILRPSIVVPTGYDPVVAWMDNFNGPIAINIAGALGIVRALYVDEDTKLDIVFVDNVAKAMIIAAWQTSLEKEKEKLMICNTCSDATPCMQKNEEMTEVVHANPPEFFFRPIFYYYTTSWYRFYFSYLIFNILPALFIDGLLLLLGKKAVCVKIQRRAYIAILAIVPFTMNSWKSDTSNYLALQKKVLKADKDNFSFHHVTDQTSMIVKCWASAKKYLLSQKAEASQKDKIRYRLIYILFTLLDYMIKGYILYLVIWKFSIPTKAYGIIQNYFEHLDSQ